MIETALIFTIITTILFGHIILLYPRFISNDKEKTRPVSIIIPARNEAHNLPNILESIKLQNSETEVIIVNDRSSDATIAVSQNYDVKIVTLNENPWNGKSYVCYSGVPHARHETLLFLDADTMLSDTNAISSMLSAYTKQNNRGILSIQPYHTTKRLYEKFSTVFNMMTVMGVNAFSALKPLRKSSTVFGPALLTNKTDYQLAGGHAYAKDRVIEGEGLYEAYEAHNLPIHLYLGKDTIHMRMYPRGLHNVIHGWSKHIASGSGNTHPIHMMMIIFFLGGAIIPSGMLFLSIVLDFHLLLWLCAYVLYGITFMFLASRVININYYDFFLYPLYIAFFFYVYGLSWYHTNITKAVTWKGRKIRINGKENNK